MLEYNVHPFIYCISFQFSVKRFFQFVCVPAYKRTYDHKYTRLKNKHACMHATQERVDMSADLTSIGMFSCSVVVWEK